MRWQDFFRDRVRQAREAQGLSKSELGRRIGVRHVQIIDYENGKKTPSVEHLVALATVLEVSVDYLLGLADDHRPSPPAP